MMMEGLTDCITDYSLQIAGEEVKVNFHCLMRKEYLKWNFYSLFACALPLNLSESTLNVPGICRSLPPF